MIDLHMHTVYSDGSVRPEDLVELGLENNLEAIAITDHDTTESLRYARQAAEGKPIDIIPGIEINTHWEKQEVHVLGYYINPDYKGIQDVNKKHSCSRLEQIEAMTNKIRAKTKTSLTFQDVLKKSDGLGSIGRPHIAKMLLEKGVVHSVGEAFSKYLSPNCSTYVNRETVSPHDAVEAIYESGGIPVVAHPGDMRNIEELAKELTHYGLRGLEAYHRSHSPALIEFHCTLAEKLGLIVTGGTDFHGTVDLYKKSLNRLHMPANLYHLLREEKKQLSLSQVKFKAS
jgi:3',5'-nucleoside bisphosphate phosphatase